MQFSSFFAQKLAGKQLFAYLCDQHKHKFMKSTVRLFLVQFLLAMVLPSAAYVEEDRVFRPLTASSGLADNSAQTLKCTRTGRMTITTIGDVNFYDGASFTHISGDEEKKYKLEDYKGHYHLYYDNDHHLWLKNKHYVSCVDLTTESYIQADSIFKNYGATSQINDMFVDTNGDLWLCENNYIFSKKYRKKIALQKGLNLQDVEVYDNKQLLLVYDNGLLIGYDVNTGKRLYQSYAYSPEDAELYSHSGVMLIYEDGVFMIRNGEEGAILVHFDVNTRKWSEVMRTEYHMNNMVVHEGKLYIASSWGYFTYYLATGEFKHYKTLRLTNGRELQTDINAIEFDLQGGMWIGTEQRGLLYARPANAPFTVLNWDNPKALEYWEMMENLKGISEFRGKKANVMFVDSRHWTWVGTPNGLYLYTTPQAEPTVYGRKNGLLNSVIHSIIEDDLNNIWVSTSYGIACVKIDEGNVKQLFCFSDIDNVPNETFINAKAIKLPNGEIVMQALDHVISFQPRDFRSLLNQPPYQMHPKLTKLLVNGIEVRAGSKVNGVVVLDKAITRTKEINLNYDQNSIALTFSALNFARPLQTYYRVRIKEINKNWTEYSYFQGGGLVDARGLLHLPMVGLQPGSYHIEVMASVVPGQYVGKPYEWVIYVNQPWWRTTGIMLILGLIILALVALNFIVYNRNTRLKMKRNNEEGDLIRRINSFVNRCDSYNSEKLSPSQEEIYGTENDSQNELSENFIELMLKVLPFIHERKDRSYTMHMLSQATDMDVIHLYELVSEDIHKSPRLLVRYMRIDQVADLLRNSDKSIEDIAEECGFVSPNYMIAKFYHKFKMTPEEYREHHEQ